jgi:cell division protein FtsI/penicillin-binding protein 2
MEHGISGWEKEFDHILRGTPGTFTVMLDRRGRWINSTFRIVTPPSGGKDIYLSELLPEKDHE